LARSTNQDAVCQFLHKLRTAFSPHPKRQLDRIVLVADNHSVHKTTTVLEAARTLNIEM
jgi:hypothetical protein